MCKIKRLTKSNLISFGYSRSGDMRGSQYSESVKLCEDGRAKVEIFSREWHNSEPKEKTFYVDGAILAEIEKVFRAYHMESWEHKKITEIFVCDGASYHYSFSFGDEYYGFSSQMYPGKYGDGTSKIHDITSKYYKAAGVEEDNG